MSPRTTGVRAKVWVVDDTVVFAVLAGGMLILTVLASWLPARRASRVDPVVTLRAQ